MASERGNLYSFHEDNARPLELYIAEQAKKATQAREEALANSTDPEVLARIELREARHAREFEEASEQYEKERLEAKAAQNRLMQQRIQQELNHCNDNINSIMEALEKNKAKLAELMSLQAKHVQLLQDQKFSLKFVQQYIPHQEELISSYLEEKEDLETKLEEMK
jgi:hypothetical protein